MCKPDSKLFSGTLGQQSLAEQNLHRAELEVKKLINSKKDGKRKATAVGAYDSKTGKVVASFAGPIPTKVHPLLKARADKIGGLGANGLTDKNTVGVCAEFHAVNKLLLEGSDINDIHLTNAIRPRTGKEVPYCQNCLDMFSDIIER